MLVLLLARSCFWPAVLALSLAYLLVHQVHKQWTLKWTIALSPVSIQRQLCSQSSPAWMNETNRRTDAELAASSSKCPFVSGQKFEWTSNGILKLLTNILLIDWCILCFAIFSPILSANFIHNMKTTMWCTIQCALHRLRAIVRAIVGTLCVHFSSGRPIQYARKIRLAPLLAHLSSNSVWACVCVARQISRIRQHLHHVHSLAALECAVYSLFCRVCSLGFDH